MVDMSFDKIFLLASVRREKDSVSQDEIMLIIKIAMIVIRIILI